MLMKLSLFRPIRVSAAGVIVAVGCGGKATESVEGIDDGHDLGSFDDDDSPGTPLGEPAHDPLADEQFNEALDEHFEHRCVELIECEGRDLFAGECQDFFVSNMHRIYDTESPYCRGLILETFSCSQEYWSCEPMNDPCSSLYFDLIDECVNVYEGPSDYDFSDGSRPPG